MHDLVAWQMVCPHCGRYAVARYRPLEMDGDRVVSCAPHSAACPDEGCAIDVADVPLMSTRQVVGD